jgi:hypothetical protein
VTGLVFDRDHPGYQRHCLRPDCTAAFNAVDVELGHASAEGWRMLTSVVAGYLCPGHARPVVDGGHVPVWLQAAANGPIDGIGCRCTWQRRGHLPTQGDYQDQWVAHLMSLDQLAREREYMRQASAPPLRGVDLSRERPGELPS